MISQRAAIVLWAFLATGCLEYHTTTTVRENGRLMRSVVIRGDSASTHQWKFVVPVDSSWEWDRARTGDREWTLTVRREFASADDFNAYQAGRTDTFLRSHVSLERSFRWFTTATRYREHLPSVNPLRSVPLSEYISPAEVEAFLQHEVHKQEFATPGDSLALEDASDRYEAWARRNEFEALFGAIRHGVRSLADRNFSPESLDARKDRLAGAYEALKDTGGVFDPEDLMKRTEEWLKRWKEPVVRRAAAAARDSIDAIVGQVRQMHRLMEFPHKATVVLPGVLTATNARTIEGSQASWEDYLVVLYFQDFTFEAEAVTTNWWAVILTALVVAGVPVGWMWSRRRSRASADVIIHG